MAKNNNHKAVSYNKWGYIFLIPFVVVYLIFQLVPLISTIYNLSLIHISEPTRH